MMLVSGVARWEEAVEQVSERMRRIAAILNESDIPYQVIGGMAVAEWVGQIDPDSARATKDVDISIRRADLPRMRTVLEGAGYRYKETLGVRMFLEAGEQKARHAIHLVFADEKVRSEYGHPAPEIPEQPSRPGGDVAFISIASLVRMKLTSFRLKDKVHLLDMLGVGLITPEIEKTLPTDLMARLQELKDNPED